MDPAMKATIMKHRSPKPPPSKHLNPLQVKLKNNPYAHALAAPVRQCAILKTRLPSSFLIRYRLVAHPETGALWYIPQGMAKPVPVDRAPSDLEEQLSLSAPPNGPSSYALSSASLLQHITLQRKKRKLFTWELLNRCQALEAKSNIIWRRDMHEFVLGLLRKRVHNETNYIATRRCFSRCATLEEVQRKKQVGFVLWFGRPSSAHRDVPNDKEDGGPMSYTTIATQRPVAEVAVYNLPRLLGRGLADALRHDFGLEPHNEAVVVKSRRSTVDAGVWLWKLEGYLAGFEEAPGECTED
ncbi:hypothetical protein GP486_003150 [Trichoglossum hirsutum]|uniref:Uncharacterized protein n=1 Tax=Trichoglossum hirsutum TaxID=265104 RepID=A0A9P8RR18_9PEZI|nr:hypothetical protein GP486_003150 [Trichoglossum hirsutum]